MRLVLVDWIDSRGVGTDWEFFTDPLTTKPKPCYIKSVGWLAHEDDECVVVIPHVADDKQGCGDMTIPKIAIKRMSDLPLPGDKS